VNLSEFKTSLVLALQQDRKSKGVSQQALARRVRVTQAYLSEIEALTKHPSDVVLQRIMDALDCSLIEMMDKGKPLAIVKSITDMLQGMGVDKLKAVQKSVKRIRRQACS